MRNVLIICGLILLAGVVGCILRAVLIPGGSSALPAPVAKYTVASVPPAATREQERQRNKLSHDRALQSKERQVNIEYSYSTATYGSLAKMLGSDTTLRQDPGYTNIMDVTWKCGVVAGFLTDSWASGKFERGVQFANNHPKNANAKPVFVDISMPLVYEHSPGDWNYGGAVCGVHLGDSADLVFKRYPKKNPNNRYYDCDTYLFHNRDWKSQGGQDSITVDITNTNTSIVIKFDNDKVSEVWAGTFSGEVHRVN